MTRWIMRNIAHYVAAKLSIDNPKGVTAIEYGLIAALIAVAAIAAMQSVGTKLGDTFNNVSGKL